MYLQVLRTQEGPQSTGPDRQLKRREHGMIGDGYLGGCRRYCGWDTISGGKEDLMEEMNVAIIWHVTVCLIEMSFIPY